jgi:hypothetical protein
MEAGVERVGEEVAPMMRMTYDTAISRGVVVYIIRRDRGCDLAGRVQVVSQINANLRGREHAPYSTY